MFLMLAFMSVFILAEYKDSLKNQFLIGLNVWYFLLIQVICLHYIVNNIIERFESEDFDENDDDDKSRLPGWFIIFSSLLMPLLLINLFAKKHLNKCIWEWISEELIT